MLQQQSWISLQTLTATGWLKCAALAYVSSFKICKCASSDKALPILIIENYLTCLNMVLTMLSEPIGGFLAWTYRSLSHSYIPPRAEAPLGTKIAAAAKSYLSSNIDSDRCAACKCQLFQKVCKSALSEKGLPVLYYD